MSKIAGREVMADEYVPYLHHVDNEVVLLNDGSRLAMFRVTGRAWETSDPGDVAGWHSQLNLLCRNIASDRLVLSVHIVRSAGDMREYPARKLRSEFSLRLDGAYRSNIARQIYSNEMFLSVLQRPASVAGDRLTSWFARRAKAPAPTEDGAKRLEETLRIIAADLASYGLRRLGLRHEGNAIFTELGEALSLILTGTRRKVPVVTGRLSRAIHADRIVFGREAIELRGDTSTYAACLGLREYPAATWAGQFSGLLRASYYFSLTQSFGFLAKQDAHGILTRKQNQMVTAGDKAYSQRDALTDAADQLASNEFVMGSHHLAMTVFADSLPALSRVTAQARSDLADSGAVVAREDLGLEAALWSHLPGNARLRTRPGVVSSRNWCGMAPLHGYPRGADKGYWGGPVTMFRTGGGTPYLFHFHVGDIGNAALFGPTGSGKTTLLLFLLSQAERVGAQVVFFDKDRGGEIMARAVGGRYLALPQGKPTGLAPLRALSGAPQDVAFLSRWVAGLIAADGYHLRPDDRRRISQGVAALLRLAPEHRSLSELRAFLGQSNMEGAGAHLDRWCAGGALGWAFDGDADHVSLDAPFLGFDMTAVLDDAAVRGPAMAYLFHRVESLIDGRRIVVAIDEFWKALADPEFRDMVNDTLKTIRKKNGAIILATQSPRDALNSPIAHSIIEQCPTQILMPNPRADAKDYVDGLKLTRPEFRMVREDLTVGPRRFLLKQGVDSVVCDLDLSGSPECIAVLSGRAQSVARMEQMMGADQTRWLDTFMEEHKEMAE